jgi:GxxExxY protein
VQEEKPSTSFTFAASVTVPEVKRIATLFPSRILCFLRFLLFQDETNNIHPNFAKADRLSGEVIGAAIEVHRIMGPGLLESIYERCLLRELELRGVPVLNQEEVVIDYKGTVFKETLRFDLLVDGCLLVELKAIQDVLPIHKAQLLSYMKLLNVPLGLLFNFHEVKLVDGISRLILPGANKP